MLSSSMRSMRRITSAEADRRIAMLSAKLKLLGEPPHTL
jgi:hypothetical protein